MIVPENVRKSVAFIGLKMADGEFQLKGTAFWVGQKIDSTGRANSIFAVTAKHVIDGIRRTGVEHVWFRINKSDEGTGLYSSNINDWYFHPTDNTVDVAVLKAGLLPDWDTLAIPDSLWITEANMKEHEIDLGDEVFITGLFRHHSGSRKNIPIVRVGNLACMSEEKVQTKDFGLMDALLIEARSIGGLSGSPVFLNLGITRLINGKFKQTNSGPIFFLLGLVHGHYDVKSHDIDELGSNSPKGLTEEQVNTGIAIVVPIHSVREVIDLFNATQETTP